MLMLLSQFDSNAQFGEAGGYQSVGDVFAQGLPMFLMGILTVFAVLCLLWFALEAFHKLCYHETPKRGAAKQAANPTPPPTAAPAPEAPAEELEIVAVIAAAIAAAQAEAPSGEFRVVSFRRK